MSLNFTQTCLYELWFIYSPGGSDADKTVEDAQKGSEGETQNDEGNKVLVVHSKPTFFFKVGLTETPFDIFANRADPDQAALVRAA